MKDLQNVADFSFVKVPSHTDIKSNDIVDGMAGEEADKAIASLSIIPESEYKQALVALAHIAVHRTA